MTMRFKSVLAIALAVAGLAVGATYLTFSGKLSGALARAAETAQSLADAKAKVSQLENAVETKEADLIGYTKYKTYLEAGEAALAGQMSLLTAKVTRDYVVTRFLTKPFFGLSSNGAVEVRYTVEYSFGFDLKPEMYDVRETEHGIAVVVGRPKLVASPGITQLRHKVLSGGMFTEEETAVIKIQQELAKSALAQGGAMASDPAVMALCEKNLTSFLYGFLEKQPGVKNVPRVTIVYK